MRQPLLDLLEEGLLGNLSLSAFRSLLPLMLLLSPLLGSNRGWTLDPKPGAVITLEDIERLEERGWRVVKAALYRGVFHDAPCPGGLLLVYKLGPYNGPLGVSWRTAEWINTMRTVRLSSVANATIYYRARPTATVYATSIAYCLGKINNTAYKIVNYLKPAYYAKSYTLEPHRMVVRVDHEAFWETLVKMVNESLVSNPKLARVARVWRGEWILELLGWRVVEKRVCSVTVVLDVPLVKASSIYYEAYEVNPVYEELVMKPLVEKLLGGCGKRAGWWLDYSGEGSKTVDRGWLLPPALLVYGGVCANWAYYSLLLARLFGLQDKLYILATGYRQAAVLCTVNPTRFPAVHGGAPGCYGLLAVDRRHNKSLICWLWDDTGYTALNWRRVKGSVYNNEDPGYYIIVETWTGCRIPSVVPNAAAR